MHKLIFILFCFSAGLLAQDAKRVQQADNYIYDGNTAFDQTNNAEAEKQYRKALAVGEKADIATYNIATTLQQDSYNEEALRAYEKLIKSTTERPKKHRSFHNIGNAMMEAKEYKRAVDAYKDALRNNPNDDETRYNYALAKKMLEDEEEKQDDQDQKDNQDNQDNKDNQNDSQDNKDDQDNAGDNGQDKNKDPNDKGENDKDQDKGDQEKDSENKDKEGDQQKDKQPPQAQPTQLSPQQVQNLLEAMSNEEKKVQDKINAKKVKAAGTKSKKDW